MTLPRFEFLTRWWEQRGLWMVGDLLMIIIGMAALVLTLDSILR